MSDCEIAYGLNNVAKAMNNCASSLHDIHQSIDSCANASSGGLDAIAKEIGYLGSFGEIASEIKDLGTFGDAKPD